MIGFIALMLLMSVIVLSLWRLWNAREDQRHRAVKAEAKVAELETLLGGSDAIVHDVSNLMSVAFVNLATLSQQFQHDPDEARVSISDVNRALEGATEMLLALRAQVDESSPITATTEGHLRLHVGLARAVAPVDLRIEADFPHNGESRAAGRVLQNLIFNAAREARLAGGAVEINMTTQSLRISNLVKDPTQISDKMFERGVSTCGSTGVGLSECKVLAPRAGWTLGYAFDGSLVTFELRKQ